MTIDYESCHWLVQLLNISIFYLSTPFLTNTLINDIFWFLFYQPTTRQSRMQNQANDLRTYNPNTKYSPNIKEIVESARQLLINLLLFRNTNSLLLLTTLLNRFF